MVLVGRTAHLRQRAGARRGWLAEGDAGTTRGIAYRYCPQRPPRPGKPIASNTRNSWPTMVPILWCIQTAWPLPRPSRSAREPLACGGPGARPPRHVRTRLDQPRPPMTLSREFLDHDEGIGAFYNLTKAWSSCSGSTTFSPACASRRGIVRPGARRAPAFGQRPCDQPGLGTSAGPRTRRGIGARDVPPA